MDELKLKNGFKFLPICQTLPTTQLGIAGEFQITMQLRTIFQTGVSQEIRKLMRLIK